MELTVINLENKKTYLIDINKQGENAMPCPVCSEERKKDRLKCFSYNVAKGVGHCNHCGVKLLKKKEFVKEEKQYKKPVWRNNTNLSDKVVGWFEQRGIKQETLLALKVTEGVEWMPQTEKEANTIQFNYFRNGELINTKFRDGSKNFKLVGGAELIPYNLDGAINEKTVIIVEGEIDALSVYQAGFKNVISVPNGANLKSNNLTYLDNCIELFSDETEFYLGLDSDLAGVKLRDELAARLGVEKCFKVAFKDCKDANECLVKYGIQGIIESISEREEYPLEGIFTSTDIDDNINDYYENGLPKGVQIGMPDFDNLLSFHKGYLTVITGIPTHGKSEVLDFICVKLNLIGGWKTAFYSPENHPLQLHFSKIAEKMIGKSFSGGYKMNPKELELSKQHFKENFWFIKPEEGFTTDNILRMTKSLIRKKGISAFVIDAWNKLDHLYETNETQYVSKELDKICLFCERNNVHCFLVAHPTKVPKEKGTGAFEIPNLYMISGSANFFNKASNGISVYRNFESGMTEVYVQKVKFKHWGGIGMTNWKWDFKNGRYYQTQPDDTNWLLEEPKQESMLINFTNQNALNDYTESTRTVIDEDPF